MKSLADILITLKAERDHLNGHTNSSERFISRAIQHLDDAIDALEDQLSPVKEC